MAISKSFLTAAFMLSFLLFHFAEAHESIQNIGPKSSLLGIDCGAACVARCRLSSRPNLCKRACGTCCDRCGCVPPGTSGNQQVCPCYFNQTTHGGKRKCP
ncbi:hypothetical protein RND81_06G081800 [Saponaria officinalis]|uniref:Snakin-2 n=1 Tax=Saponaria officinalis TaxID=3572 RepID=A0AAW1K9D1_SAPOF